MIKNGLIEFWYFGIKQAYACLFAGLFLLLVVASHFYFPLSTIHRYDFLFLSAVFIQAILILTKLETKSEFAVILVFHVIATVMEIFKTSQGSWVYPDQSNIKIYSVPLFAGFMYSAVGSYIARIWRIFNFSFTNFPSRWMLLTISALIYMNFFTHHYFYDIRWALILIIAVLLRKTHVNFTVLKIERSMHLLLGLILVALFIWFAENISTYCRIWFYPNQINGWTIVSPQKITAWFLLMFISFSLVSALHSNHNPNQSLHQSP